jgi:hypothetical protein
MSSALSSIKRSSSAQTWAVGRHVTRRSLNRARPFPTSHSHRHSLGALPTRTAGRIPSAAPPRTPPTRGQSLLRNIGRLTARRHSVSAQELRLPSLTAPLRREQGGQPSSLALPPSHAAPTSWQWHGRVETYPSPRRRPVCEHALGGTTDAHCVHSRRRLAPWGRWRFATRGGNRSVNLGPVAMA